MHQRINHADKQVGTCRKGRSATATSTCTSSFLTIPKLGKNVLAKTDSSDAKEWLKIANLCTSLVGDDFQVDENSTIHEIINTTLSEWASQYCREIQVLDSFDFIVALNDEQFGLESNDDSKNLGHWFIAIEAGQVMNHVMVDQKLMELESVYAGLGKTALHVAEKASFRTFTILTPSIAKDIAIYLYWHGEETDADVIETLKSEGVEQEDLDGFFLPSQFIEPFNPLFFDNGMLTETELLAIAKNKNVAGDVAKTILSILELMNDGARLPNIQDYSNDSVYFSCTLGIDADIDPLIRVLDDHFEMANYSETYTSLYGVAKVPFDMEAFQQWRVEMEKGFLLYGKLDQLIRLIKKGD